MPAPDRARLGRKALHKLRKDDLAAFVRSMERDGKSRQSIAYALTVLRIALKDAVDDGKVPSNAAAKVRGPSPNAAR